MSGKAAEVARTYNMKRAFAIAPTASCSYRVRTLDGYTATPEIAPPISTTVDRDSGTFGVETVLDYGDVETASEVGWDDYKRAADNIMIMHSAHGTSFFTGTHLTHGQTWLFMMRHSLKSG